MTFKDILLDIAKNAIGDKLLSENTLMSKDEAVVKFNEFSKQGATFVTLNKNGSLRGCIGSLVAHKSLYDDLVHNAQSAAFGDPRFNQVSSEELEQLDIEVSILTQAVKVNYTDAVDLKSKIIPNKDGIILRLNQHQATFLPQVWESLPTFEKFFEHLCNKAGLMGECLKHHPEIFKYSVKKYK
jgi:AmmeMemoRadiSam system protein A